MARNLFSVPIFFIVFRETLEAAIVVSVLLGLAEQIAHEDTAKVGAVSLAHERESGALALEEASSGADANGLGRDTGSKEGSQKTVADADALRYEDSEIQRRRLIRKLRIHIFAGAGLGLLIAVAIGAAFIAVWFTKAANLWSKSEELWEGIFSLVASIMIFVMGVTMLRMDRAKAKWRIKLQSAFDSKNPDGSAKTGKWAFFVLPFVTVLREGMEAVVFVGGVSLGQAAASIPIAAIVGLVCGLVVGFIIYEFASHSTLSLFLVVMTNFLLLIGAGLFSKATGDFQMNAFNHLLGAEIDDARGNGPGSYRVQGNVWHLDCCNPRSKLDGGGWMIFAAIFGWTNSATLGTVLSYVFYWVVVVVTVVCMKYAEGRTRLMGHESMADRRTHDIEQEEANENSAVDMTTGNETRRAHMREVAQ